MNGRRSQNPNLTSLPDRGFRVEIEAKNSREKTEVEPMAENIENLVAQQAQRVPHVQQRMKEFARPNIGISPSCIILPDNARNYELKHLHFNMLPSFHGSASEDPLIFMREYYATIQTFPLQDLTEDQLKMKCFPYTLKDAAKAWFMALAPGSLTTWEAVYNKFIGKFYSHAKTTELRGKIAIFSQMDGEPFHEAWDRFKFVLIQCPHHGYPLELLNQFFYDGLTQPCQAMVDNAAGGAMGEKTPEETYELYEMLGANSQQKSARGKTRGLYEVNTNSELSMQMTEMAKQMKAMCVMMGQRNQPQAAAIEVCSFCGNNGHLANVCPSSAGENEQANAMNFYNQRSRNDPFSNSYNPGWRNHPNFSWANDRNQNQAGTSFQQQPKKPTLEDTMQSFIQATQNQFQNNANKFQTIDSRFQNMEAAMKKMETQLGQIAEAVQGHQPGTLPSQPEQAKSITTLRSGKVIDKRIRNETDEIVVSTGLEKERMEAEEDTHSKKAVFPVVDPPVNYKTPPPYNPPVPFPGRLRQSKLDKSFSDIYDILSKVNVNLPLLDMIKNMPAYAKFFKELNTRKRRYEPNEKVVVSEVVSAVLQTNLPPKLKDPGSFTISITVGGTNRVKAMLDLGASINLMPYSVFVQLGLGDLKPTTMSLQLADRSVKYPRGIVEDILVQIDNLIVPADFVVMDMERQSAPEQELPILLGRPFMATTKTNIDVQNGKLKMTVLDETVEVSVYNAL